MTIAALAREGGVGVETVRYYQRRGLLDEPDRPTGAGAGGGIRRYGTDDARRLRFIRSAQAAGFTLEQIGELLALDATDDRARARQLAHEQMAALDAKIAELEQARASLRRLASECGSGSAGPCPILTAFDSPTE
ncbi:MULTISPECIES: MerR family DNA-binding protein [Sphingomonas]|nr:MerR family DNA-binding protein [Sphingomonas sp. EC-HK361]AXJ97405.1 MerR family transcriptional regulator [Sphingomonas sp. FARSPH]PVE50571.1 MerR family DNA-binding transcriptional regulator [Sphingomonas sp. TPD3009]PVE50974.1 MerR family DNA-binding transcriptional regulator [Arthrobacter sp. TPD3018]PVE80219.1 MerR family DNA-binding transcriptional regulator [Sphingomonas melonis]RSV48450.1 MerR family transcriptional regulator [Sphingomonas sp. ABOLD]RTL19616.1 MAG: MerR family tra